MDEMNDEELAERTSRRLPVPDLNWVQELAFEAALGYFTPQELQLKFGLDETSYQRITELPDFQKAEAGYRREIDDEGIGFRLRARKAAELILDELYAMAFDRTIEAEVRRKIMNDLCRLAGFEAKSADDGGGIKLQIYTNLNMGPRDQTYTIEIPEEKSA